MNRIAPSISPFPDQYRAAGVLLHASSLPSEFGIGDFGPSAIEWIDLLAHAGFSWWQVLPLGPTGFGNCPYQAISSAAGNPVLISPDALVEDGLLAPTDIVPHVSSPGGINFAAVRLAKQKCIEQAWIRLQHNEGKVSRADFTAYCERQRGWLDDFATFECLRRKFGTGRFSEWPIELRDRHPATLLAYQTEYAAEIDLVKFEQFLIHRQMKQIKDYANARNIRLIGDIPFFPSPESVDVWKHPELFLLDQNLRPTFIAGVPPDYFSPTGQLWGNPVYHWKAMQDSGYQWWLYRIRDLLEFVDVIRLDHFRGFAAAWHVRADETTALNGSWVPGPGADFFNVIRSQLNGLPFLAEDLGDITDDVLKLRDQFQLSGMRVLQFGFDGQTDNPFLPQNYPLNSVAYTATHDNDTTLGWYRTLPPSEKAIVDSWLQRQPRSTLAPSATHPVDQLAESVWRSKAALVMTPLQDILHLDSDSRMNVPGCADGNWGWRCTREQLRSERFDWYLELNSSTGRLPTLTGQAAPAAL